MVEYYTIPLGAILLPKTADITLKFVGFVLRGARVTDQMEVQECSRPGTNPGGYAQEIIFFSKKGKEDLIKLIDETLKKFDVQKVIWRHPPIEYKTKKEVWAEATCYLIVEGETNVEEF